MGDRRYVCTRGHDRCYGGSSAGPECPYCERRPPAKRRASTIGEAAAMLFLVLGGAYVIGFASAW